MKIVVLLLSLSFLLPIRAEAAMVNKVIAIVNDEIITKQDVDNMLSILYAQYAQTLESDALLEKMEKLKNSALDQIVEDRLVLSAARELGIEATEGEVEERLAQIRYNFSSEEEFHKTLEAQGITVSSLKNRYRDQIMMKKAVDRELKTKVSVAPSEISEFYERHKEHFKIDERYKVRHILVKADTSVDFELAKIEIESIYNQLKEGADFSQLAKLHSQGPNKEEGGDMGYIERGEMLEILDAAIFNLGIGEISEPLKSNLGYHIFKVEDIRHSGYVPLIEVKNEIHARLFQSKLKLKLEKWLTELKEKAYISIKE